MTEQINVLELIQIMDEIRREVDGMQKPNLEQTDLSKGFAISKMACAQPTKVEMTPIFKNALKYYGWPEGKRLMVDDPPTKAELEIHNTIESKLNTLIGPKALVYNTSLPIYDPQHYVVDCWRNLKDNMRDIQPGQAEQRALTFDEYGTPARDMGVRTLLQNNALFSKAVSMVFGVLPQIKASNDIITISQPFLKKHTNTSYPFYLNDRTIVPGTSKTAGEVTRDMAEDIMNHDDWYDKLKQYAVWLALARNQRGKGRGLEASSRVLNLVINMIEAPEIEACKNRSPLFAGYKPPADLKRVLCEMADTCKRNNLWATNWDQSAYDKHVSRDLIELIGAMAVLKANGSKSKKLAKARAVYACRGWMVRGDTMTIEEIFGRIFSGYIDTNLGGGKINAIISVFVLMLCDPKYSSLWYSILYIMLVMGDDNLQIHDHIKHETYVREMSKLGFEVNPNKGEEGIFFLQRRIFTPRGGSEYVMVTPCTRVIKSLLFKEHSSSLGPFGWTAANIQILSQLIEYPPALDVAVSVIYPFDKMKLGTELTADQLAAGITEEDRMAREQKQGKRRPGKRNANTSAAAARRRVRYTAELLYDGDPSKEALFSFVEGGEPVLNQKFVTKVLNAIRDSVKRTGVKTLVQQSGMTDPSHEEVVDNGLEDEAQI